MPQTVASLQATLGLDASQFKREAQGVTDSLTNIKGQMGGLGQLAPFAGLLAGAAAVGGVLHLAESAISATANAIKGITVEAFQAVASYETMNRSLTQLTATQLVQAGVTKDMGRALQMASTPAKELINWVERLAIESPFNSQDIANTLRMAEAFGFSEKEAKRLTQDLVDFASGAGLTQDALHRISLSLGQILTNGKVTGMELRELAMAGLPIKQILATSLGVTTAEIEKLTTAGLMPAGKAIRAIETYLEQNFTGAAKRATGTWQGLMTSIDDIKSRDLRAVFTGMFEAIQPEAAKIVNYLGSDAFYGKLQEVGKGIGIGFKAGLDTIKQMLANLDKAGTFDGLKKLFAGGEGGQEAIGQVIGGVITAIGKAAVEIVAFGRTFIAVEGAAIQAAIEMLNVVTGVFNAMAAIINNFNQGLGYTSLALNYLANRDFANAGIAFANARGFFDTFGQAVAATVTALPTLEGEMGKVGDVASGLVTQLSAIAQAHDSETAAVLRGASAYATFWDQAAHPEKYFIGPPTSASPKWGSNLGIKSTTPEDKAVANALSAGLPTVFSTGGDTVKKKIESAFDRLADGVKSVLDGVSNTIKGLIPKGMLPGVGEPNAPGANSWSEQFYRIADVAVAKERGKGKDTDKWLAQYFPGMNLDQATGPARAITQAAAMGDWLNPVLAPYMTKDVWGQIGNQTTQQLQGQKTQQYLGQAVAGLMASGKELTPENIKAMVDELAKADKDNLVPSLKDIQAAVAAMDGNVTGGSNLANVVNAINALPRIPTAGPTPPGTTPPTGTTVTPPGTGPGWWPEGYASGTRSAKAGYHWTGEEGPELTYTPPGMTIWDAQTSRQIKNGNGGGLLERLGAAIEDKAADVDALAQQFINLATGRVIGSMTAMMEGRML